MPLFPFLDPNYGLPGRHRKSQFAATLDPKWQTSLLWYPDLPFSADPLAGTNAHVPVAYINRGAFGGFQSTSAFNVFGHSGDGAYFNANDANAGIINAAGASGITWYPSQGAGSILVCFRSTLASTDASASRAPFGYGVQAASKHFLAFNWFNDGNLYAGWNDNNTWRIIVSTSGLWNAGDLVILAVTWDASVPTQTLYVNGRSISTVGTCSPGNMTGDSGNQVAIGDANGTGSGFRQNQLYVAVLDRALTASEIGYVQENPFNWLFLPSDPITNVSLAPSPPPTGFAARRPQWVLDAEDDDLWYPQLRQYGPTPPLGHLRVSQSMDETLIRGGTSGFLRVSQALDETLLRSGGHLRVSQICDETLIYNGYPNCLVPIFPSVAMVPGRTYPVTRSQVFASLVDGNFSGREGRYPQNLTPFWQFDLKFNFMRDATQNITPWAPYASFTELQQIVDLYNWCNANSGSFYFDDPTDDSRTGQAIATGDGTTVTFPVVRTLNKAGSPTLTEVVGGVNFNKSSTVYLSGVAQSASTYTISGNTLTFNTAPSDGVAITMDFWFWYLCRFIDPKLEGLQEFMKNLWQLGQLRFRSLINTAC